jgi:hypothetical protein
MDFADASTVSIPRPFALSWRMADPLMEATGLCYLAIGRPFSGGGRRIIARMGFHNGLARRTIAAVPARQADVPAAASNPPGNRWSGGFPGAMTPGLIGTTARRVLWWPFSPAFW